MYQHIVIEAKKKLVSTANHIPARYLGSHDLNNSVFYEERAPDYRFIILGGSDTRNQGSQGSTPKPKGSTRNKILKIS